MKAWCAYTGVSVYPCCPDECILQGQPTPVPGHRLHLGKISIASSYLRKSNGIFFPSASGILGRPSPGFLCSTHYQRLHLPNRRGHTGSMVSRKGSKGVYTIHQDQCFSNGRSNPLVRSKISGVHCDQRLSQ